MKRKTILLLLILLLPFMVNAKSKYLYNVIKDEAESNGLAIEYTGNHHDSYTKEPTKKVYYWSGPELELAEKTNVVFANHCWRMMRTTDTGGVKLMYYGVMNHHQMLKENILVFLLTLMKNVILYISLISILIQLLPMLWI